MGIQDIKGVGPATIKKLNKAGVRTLADLRSMDVGPVSEKTGLDAERLKEWKTEAKMLKVLEDVKGIGPATKKKLQDAGIHSVDDLARAAIHEVAHATNITQARLKEWQKDANRLLKQAEGYVKKEASVVAERTKPARDVAVTKGRQAAAAAKKGGEAAAKRGREVATVARQRGGEIVHDVKDRVGDLRPKTPTDEMPAGGHSAEAEDATAPTTGTNGSSNGDTGFIAKLKKIFVKA